MTVAAPPIARPRADAPRATPWIPLFPTLWPSMMRPAVGAAALPFPLADPGRREFTFARYGIFAVARALRLEGREVLFPAFFHCVELDALLAAGARVTFYPVGADLRLDPQQVADRIGSRTAAVYVIHYAGFPAPIRALASLCRDRGLALIEDCAHALLSHDDGQPLGSFGDAAAFSLPKSLPTPDGGVATVREGWPKETGRRARPRRAWLAAHSVSLLLSNLEMRRVPAAAGARRLGLRVGKAAYSAAGAAYIPMGTPDFDLAQVDTGMSRLSRRIARTQDFAAIARRRRGNYRFLRDRLDGIAPPIFGELSDSVCPLFYPFRTDHRDAVLARLRSRGMQVGEFWPDRHPLAPESEFAEVKALRRTALWLPCHQDMTPDALEWLVAQVAWAVRGDRS
jgi:dTDP-4-amino-4,6-dideoxygalactose transaminase